MSTDAWEPLAGQFVDEAYASVKGQVRTYVLHHHLMDHLPKPPAAILDVGGGAGHQSLPLARGGVRGDHPRSLARDAWPGRTATRC
jgi:S-adenosylmethionine-dependent methyltransferase